MQSPSIATRQPLRLGSSFASVFVLHYNCEPTPLGQAPEATSSALGLRFRTAMETGAPLAGEQPSPKTYAKGCHSQFVTLRVVPAKSVQPVLGNPWT